jgi:ABC-2 type transport system permease protein
VVCRSLADLDGDVAADPGRFDTIRSVARIAGGPAALAVGFAREGRVPASLGALALGVALLAAILWGWAVALDRALTSGRGSGVRPGRTPRPLRPRLLPFLPTGRMGAVAAKELRLTWRDPRQRVALFGIVFAAAVPVFSLRALSSTSPRVLLLAAMPAFILGTQATNQFGFDGPAHWVSVATGDDPRPELTGKNLARFLIAAPCFVLAVVGLSLRAGSIEFVVPAVGLASAGFGIAMGLGNWFSVTSPVPLPDSRANVFSAGNTGQGLAAAGPALAVLFGGAFLVAPLLVAIFVAGHSSVALSGLGLIGVAVGVGAWRFGTGLAVRAVRHRQPELLAELSVRA